MLWVTPNPQHPARSDLQTLSLPDVLEQQQELLSVRRVVAILSEEVVNLNLMLKGEQEKLVLFPAERDTVNLNHRSAFPPRGVSPPASSKRTRGPDLCSHSLHESAWPVRLHSEGESPPRKAAPMNINVAVSMILLSFALGIAAGVLLVDSEIKAIAKKAEEAQRKRVQRAKLNHLQRIVEGA